MENVKIVFDIDTTSVKSSTQDLVALNKVTETEIETLKRLEAESNANKVAFQQLSKELKSANNELLNAKKSFGDTSKEAQAAQKNVDALTDKMAELKQTVKPVEDAFVSLRQRVKEAKEEAVQAAEKYGEFSKEAQAAKIKAGQLADQMGDLNRQVNLLNPEAKAKAFSNLAQGVVGAFAIATGALQAFGVKNKEVEELAMKLQGALNITQGIASIGQLKESLQDVKVVLGFTTAAQESLVVATEAEALATTEATVAQKGFTASLATNPIFLAVAAIGALAGAYILLNDQTKSAILNEKELADLKKKTVELKDKEKQTAIDLAVANGEYSKQEGERRKIELKRIEDTKELQKQIQKLNEEEKRNTENAKKTAELDESVGKEALKRAQENNKKIAESRAALQEQINVINKTAKNETDQQTVDELNENKSKNDKKLEQDKAKREKDKAEAEKIRKDGQQKFDQDMAELEAQAKIEADKIQEKNKEKLALEKQLQDEINRARLLAVKGDRIKELQVQMDILDEQYATDILNAERTGKDTTGIKAKYANDQTSINQQITEAAVQEGNKQVKAGEDAKAKQLKTEEELKLERIQKAKFAVDAIATLNQTLVELQRQQYSQEAADVQALYDKKLITEKQYQDRLRVIKRKEWEANKRASIATATIGIAQGIINALTIQPSSLMPWAIALASTVGAVQIATIASQKPPQFAKGTLSVPGIDMGKDSVHAILQPGEAVIPTKTNRAYHPTIKAIYEKKISPSEINNFVMSRTKSGGSSAITANVDTYALTRALGKNKTVEVGNANVIGRAMARELLRGQNYRRA